MTDLIERLREYAKDGESDAADLNEAADALEAKDKEIERLRAALERIEAMSERPKCVCGRPTGTAAIKACALEALQDKDPTGEK